MSSGPEVHQVAHSRSMAAIVASAALPAARAADKIIIEGLKFFGYHGVLPKVRLLLTRPRNIGSQEAKH